MRYFPVGAKGGIPHSAGRGGGHRVAGPRWRLDDSGETKTGCDRYGMLEPERWKRFWLAAVAIFSTSRCSATNRMGIYSNRILLSGCPSTGRTGKMKSFSTLWSGMRKTISSWTPGLRAAGILRQGTVCVRRGRDFEPYDKLIIATGSRPYIPPIEG